jgi:hypothetical protein
MYINKGFVRRNKLSISIILFLIIFSFIHYNKPSLIYNRDGGFRPFGIGYKHKTVLPIWVFAIIISILCYLAISYYLLFG